MIRILFSIIATASFLMIGGTVFARDAGGKIVEPAVIMNGAKVTAVKGNIVTIMDKNGRKRVLEMDSVKGIAVGGVTGWCEEDACREMRIGGRVFKVRKVMPEATRTGPELLAPAKY